MKRLLIFIAFSLLIFQILAANTFKFAFITDLHIQMEKSSPDQDLNLVIEDINKQNDINFVLVAGDVTEYGDKQSLEKAKLLLSQLKKPYYITMGNHDQKLSEPRYDYFNDVFGDNKFAFFHKGIYFVGFATRPVAEGGNGQIALKDIDWVENKLAGLSDAIPVLAITHYPLQTGDVDNWSKMTNVLKKFNVLSVLGGHYHRNVLFNYQGIPGIVNRSTLKNKEGLCGYSIYTISDSLHVSEKHPGSDDIRWLSLPLEIEITNEPEISHSQVVESHRKCIFGCLKKRKSIAKEN